jgi:hypothetical protein
MCQAEKMAHLKRQTHPKRKEHQERKDEHVNYKKVELMIS